MKDLLRICTALAGISFTIAPTKIKMKFEQAYSVYTPDLYQAIISEPNSLGESSGFFERKATELVTKEVLEQIASELNKPDSSALRIGTSSLVQCKGSFPKMIETYPEVMTIALVKVIFKKIAELTPIEQAVDAPKRTGQIQIFLERLVLNNSSLIIEISIDKKEDGMQKICCPDEQFVPARTIRITAGRAGVKSIACSVKDISSIRDDDLMHFIGLSIYETVGMNIDLIDFATLEVLKYNVLLGLCENSGFPVMLKSSYHISGCFTSNRKGVSISRFAHVQPGDVVPDDEESSSSEGTSGSGTESEYVIPNLSDYVVLLVTNVF